MLIQGTRCIESREAAGDGYEEDFMALISFGELLSVLGAGIE